MEKCGLKQTKKNGEKKQIFLKINRGKSLTLIKLRHLNHRRLLLRRVH